MFFLYKLVCRIIDEITSLIKDCYHLVEHRVIYYKKYFFRIVHAIEDVANGGFVVVFDVWDLMYDFFPEWITACSILIVLLTPYFVWVTTNILFLIILFSWYLTVFCVISLNRAKYDNVITEFILKYIIIKFKYIINFIKLFKFNYSFLINSIFFLLDYLNYTKKNTKYNYDLYGNSLILIRKSFINIFKDILYINFYIDSFYYHLKLTLDWRTMITFHMDDSVNRDPEDYDQILFFPLFRFKYYSNYLKIFENITKYTLFDRFSKRRRFNFFYRIKKSFIVYFLLNIKNYFILLFIISFLNIIFLNIILKILKYITTL